MIGGRNPNHPSFFIEDVPKVETVPVVEFVPVVDTVEPVTEEPKEEEPKEDEEDKEDLYKLTKKEQVARLVELGVSKEDIKKLKYEGDRVKVILEMI